jgi:hypothetical protein
VPFARFADVVIGAAANENPDRDAIKIILAAADAMAESILLAADRLTEPPNNYPFVLQGELFVECPAYLQRVQSVLMAHRIHAELGKKQPIHGAFNFALKVPTGNRDAQILPE